MAVKCVAIGNRLMGDDSIGIKVIENISQKLLQNKIEIIFGETDVNYALSKIDDGDFLFIIDSTYFNISTGTVTFININETKLNDQVYSQHQPSLIKLLKIYGKSVEGFIIGIEAKRIDLSLEISDELNSKLFQINEEVYNFINNAVGNFKKTV